MKVILSKIKKNLQETNSGGYETEYQINNLEHKEGKGIQSEQQEEKRIKKHEDRLRILWDISKCSNIRIIRVPEREVQASGAMDKGARKTRGRSRTGKLILKNNERKVP